MALTKLPRNAIGTGAIDNTKIEDGTIQAVELSGTLPDTKLSSTLDISGKTVTLPNTSVTSDQLVNTTIANAKLSNSTITVRGTSRALGDSFSLQVDVDWQSVQTGDFTASAGKGYFINTTSAVVEVTLPASASIGDTIAIKDYAGTFATNNLTIARNGHNIQGVTNDSLISTNRASLVLVYVDSTKGWLFTDEHNVADLQGPTFITATGGTITTSGDFKIHSFTGDGCFVVSQLGNAPTVPTGGPTNVDYLVVAGGGGSGGDGGGGGGAGGYRTTFPSPGCNAGAFPISSTTYPITVGSGGTISGLNGNPGSPSFFSTITSTGGGDGGVGGGGVQPGGSGGSGGGGGTWVPGGSGGTGNSPPTSPSQGNNGGAGQSGTGPRAAGGGGGSTSSGSAGSGGTGGSGGNGTANLIIGSSVTYAGGGGGGGNSPGTAGPGGGGAGGAGGPGNSGAANTGGGAGGGGNSGSFCGALGGSGIVIIRYKFQ